MISITPYGSKEFQAAVEKLPTSVHLYVDTGELKGYGYEPKLLQVSNWSNGDYPELMWEFKAENEPAYVMGYFVSDAQGQVLFSDAFDESYKIQNQGDRIGVSIRLKFIGSIGGN